MYFERRPDIRISKALKRLPPNEADEIAEEVINYVKLRENELASNSDKTTMSTYWSLKFGRHTGANINEPLFSDLKPWR